MFLVKSTLSRIGRHLLRRKLTDYIIKKTLYKQEIWNKKNYAKNVKVEKTL